MKKKIHRIGFILSNDNPTDFIGDNSEANKEELSAEPLVEISNKNEGESSISPAHAEVRGRILVTEMLIEGENFAVMTKEKKKELLDELKFLTALDVELSN